MKCVSALLLSLCIFFQRAPPAEGVFSQISVSNFDKLCDGRSYLVVLFCDAGAKCESAGKEFRAAAKSFDLFHEVVFGAVDVSQDRVMALRFNIHSVPTILLFPYTKTPLPFLQSITAEEIVNTITASRLEGRLYSRVHLNEHLLGQHFTDVHAKMKAREITVTSFKKEVTDNKKHVLLALYTEGCMDECTVFDMVHNVFRDDDDIAILKMDVTKASDFAHHYQMAHNPTLIWFPPEDKEMGKIYGGEIVFRELVSFLNSETGAERALDGRIKEDAGRIEEFDAYLNKHIKDLISSKNLKAISDGLKELSKTVKAPKRFVQYYIRILETSVVRGTIDQVLEAENDYITQQLSKKKISSKERDEWTKFRNIVSGVVDLAARQLLDIRAENFEAEQQHAREAAERRREEERRRKEEERRRSQDAWQEAREVEDALKQPVEWVSHHAHDEL